MKVKVELWTTGRDKSLWFYMYNVTPESVQERYLREVNSGSPTVSFIDMNNTLITVSTDKVSVFAVQEVE